jgi:hypothetical protein
MAEKYSIGRKASSAPNSRGVRKRQQVHRKPPSVATHANLPKNGTRVSGAAGDRRELALRLKEIARTLNVIYSTCVTAQMALKGQNAEQDSDVLAMLRVNVADPVSRQAERLDSIARSLAK